MPVPAAKVGVAEFDRLNEANFAFCSMLRNPDKLDAPPAFFISEDGGVRDASPSITSFLCTDDARDIFEQGVKKFDGFSPRYPKFRFPDAGPDVLSNEKCLEEAIAFYKYADVDGYRGSPHKL